MVKKGNDCGRHVVSLIRDVATLAKLYIFPLPSSPNLGFTLPRTQRLANIPGELNGRRLTWTIRWTPRGEDFLNVAGAKSQCPPAPACPGSLSRPAGTS